MARKNAWPSGPPSPEEFERLYRSLGTTRKLAAHYGVSTWAINNMMKQLGVEAKAQGRKRSFDPTASELQQSYDQLGSLRALADHYGVAVGTIHTAIKRVDVKTAAPKSSGPRKPKKKKAPPRLLEPTPEIVARLGKVADGVLAVELGLSRTGPTVRRWREERGIPAVQKGGPGKRRKTDAERDQNLEDRYPGILKKLGVQGDREIAQEYGIAHSGVRKMRSVRGIASPWPRRS